MTRQSGPPILCLVVVLLIYSGPAEGQKTTKYLSNLNDTRSEWQTPEELREESNEMRMVGSDIAKGNQYPYMVISYFKLVKSERLVAIY